MATTPSGGADGGGPGRAPVAYFARHLAVGLIGASVFGGLVLGFDVAGLGSLIAASAEPALGYFLLFFGLSITFGSAALAAAVMGLRADGGAGMGDRR